MTPVVRVSTYLPALFIGVLIAGGQALDDLHLAVAAYAGRHRRLFDAAIGFHAVDEGIAAHLHDGISGITSAGRSGRNRRTSSVLPDPASARPAAAMQTRVRAQFSRLSSRAVTSAATLPTWAMSSIWPSSICRP